jgi:hypothetical protein
MVATMNTPTVQKQFTIESNIPYVNLRSRACANLDLDPSNAELGYHVSGAEGPNTLPSSFDSGTSPVSMYRQVGMSDRCRV